MKSIHRGPETETRTTSTKFSIECAQECNFNPQLTGRSRPPLHSDPAHMHVCPPPRHCTNTTPHGRHPQECKSNESPQAVPDLLCTQTQCTGCCTQTQCTVCRTQTQCTVCCPQTQCTACCTQTQCTVCCPQTQCTVCCPQTRCTVCCPQTQCTACCPQTRCTVCCPQTQCTACCPQTQCTVCCVESCSEWEFGCVGEQPTAALTATYSPAAHVQYVYCTVQPMGFVCSDVIMM